MRHWRHARPRSDDGKGESSEAQVDCVRLAVARGDRFRSRGGRSVRPGDGGDTLTIYAQSGDRIPFEAALAIWKKQNPNVDVRVTYADTNPYQSTLRTQLAAGTAADVFTVWPGNGNPAAIQVLAPYRYLADLSKEAFAKQEPAGIKAVTRVNGKLYFVPPAFSGIGAIYNMGTLNRRSASGRRRPGARSSLSATRRRKPASPRTRSASRTRGSRSSSRTPSFPRSCTARSRTGSG